MKVILLTGEPGVGKTTMISRLCNHFSGRLTVQGITTREIRERGLRVGFKVTDIATGEEGWLARKNYPQGPRVGSYSVVTEDLERIGVTALDRAIKERAQIAVVDEIGPMEMTSLKFKKTVAELFDSKQPTIATVKLGSHYSEVEKIRAQSTEMMITRDNREEIYQELLEQVEQWNR